VLFCGPKQSTKFVLLLTLTAASLACGVQGQNVQEGNSASSTPTPHLYSVTLNGKYGFIDESGNLKFTHPDDVYTIGPFSDGLSVVAKRVPNTYGRWGYVDPTGKLVIEAKFNVARNFSEGLAAVIVSEREGAEGKIGYIDRTGRFVIQPQFEQGGVVSDFAFSEGLAGVVSKNGRWGFIDKTGKFVIEPQFHSALPFSEGRALVGVAESPYSLQQKYGFIDKQGRWIVTPQYVLAGKFSEGLAPVLIGDKVGFIDLQGQIVIKPQFTLGGACPDTGSLGASVYSEGLAAVHVDDWKWGFIDRSGKWVIKPAYGCAHPFSEGLAVIGVRNKEGLWRYGYIDKTGVTIIKPEFSYASSFVGKLARVGIGTSEDEALLKAMKDYEAGKPEAQIEKELESHKPKYGYIDRTGKFVWTPTN
jgi:hypothetical protein